MSLMQRILRPSTANSGCADSTPVIFQSGRDPFFQFKALFSWKCCPTKYVLREQVEVKRCRRLGQGQLRLRAYILAEILYIVSFAVLFFEALVTEYMVHRSSINKTELMSSMNDPLFVWTWHLKKQNTTSDTIHKIPAIESPMHACLLVKINLTICTSSAKWKGFNKVMNGMHWNKNSFSFVSFECSGLDSSTRSD